MNNFIEINHAFSIRWKAQLGRVLSQFLWWWFLLYPIVISSSGLRLSRCHFISLVGTRLRSLWRTLQSSFPFAGYLFTISYPWNSCSISHLLSSLDWYSWHALYSGSNRYIRFGSIDAEHTAKLFLSEAVTFLGNQERDRNLYAIPGLDYVAHEDVIPYTVIQVCFYA